MKTDRDLRITIVGMGNLMEALLPMFRALVGAGRAHRQINATTADDDFREKSARLGIPVRYKNNLPALMEMEPDIIMFAPPPSLAIPLVQTDLKQYFDACRDENRTLPAVYAYPPLPRPDYYTSVLGDDVVAATIIPDTVRTIGGRPVRGEGIHLVTVCKPWPADDWALLQRVFSPLGEVVEVTPDEGMPVLAGLVVLALLTWKGVTFLAEQPQAGAKGLSHREIASYLRARAKERYGYQPPKDSDPCGTEHIPAGPLASLLDRALQAWHSGVTDYWSSAGIPSDKQARIIGRDIGFRLHIAQCESVETINRHLVIGATKGGVLERGLEIFWDSIGPQLAGGLSAGGPAGADWPELKHTIQEACRLVYERGMALNR